MRARYAGTGEAAGPHPSGSRDQRPRASPQSWGGKVRNLRAGASGRWSGFTLIELLVVLGIIGVLVALLLPTLARSRVRATTPVCLNNFKQLQLAWLLYAWDNEDRLPPNPSGIFSNIPTLAAWVDGWMGYSKAGGARATDATNTALLLERRPGRISPYLRTAGVYKCPADRQLAICDGRPVSRVRTCAMNAFVDGDGATDKNSRDFTRLSSIRQPPPERLFVFIDVHEDSLDHIQFIPTPHWQISMQVDLPASRHIASCPVSFADGHAIIKRWKDPRTLRKVTGQRTFVENTGRSDNNEDIRWLYRHGADYDPRWP